MSATSIVIQRVNANVGIGPPTPEYAVSVNVSSTRFFVVGAAGRW